MTRCRIYTDLDETLVSAVERRGRIVGVLVRPDAEWFVERLARHCDLWLLTRADRSWAAEGLDALGPAKAAFGGIISREDLAPVAEQIRVVAESGVSRHEAAELLGLIEPIAPPGVVFDDYAVGSDIFLLKSLAVSIGADRWIEVDTFSETMPDRGGLRKAYQEFRRRFAPRPTMGVMRA